MASLLKGLESQNQKKCDKDIKGCDTPSSPLRSLLNVPAVFTMLVAWEENVSAEEIKSTLEVIDTEVGEETLCVRHTRCVWVSVRVGWHVCEALTLRVRSV